jgi:hypothetical protein
MILLISVAVFALCVAVPELARIKTYGLGDKTISHYLRGKLGYITDIGFLVCFGSMQFVAYELGLTVAGIAASVFGLGILLAMLTARCAEWLPSSDFAKRAHVVVTIIALLAAVVLMVAESRDVSMVILWIAAVAVTGLGFAMRAPIAVIEKIAVLMIALWLVAYALTALS